MCPVVFIRKLMFEMLTMAAAAAPCASAAQDGCEPNDGGVAGIAAGGGSGRGQSMRSPAGRRRSHVVPGTGSDAAGGSSSQGPLGTGSAREHDAVRECVSSAWCGVAMDVTLGKIMGVRDRRIGRYEVLFGV